MNKSVFIFLLALLTALTGLRSYSQVNEWIWMDGLDTTNSYGDYPQLRTPGGRLSAATAEDTSGNLWLFGGYGYAITGGIGLLNDLWKYNLNSGHWTWMGGGNSLNQSSIYGTQGSAASTNQPGGRQLSMAWIDTEGNFWLFGGGGSVLLNDLWKFDVISEQWTWMGGSSSANQTSTYGTQGTAASSNIPGARTGSCTWTDASGDFWLFGGYGKGSSTTSGYLQDLWKYNVATNQWTWMKGTGSINQNGSYGTQGLDTVTNLPGGRHYLPGWIDSAGVFWMYGGEGYAASGSLGRTNDLWKFDPSTNNWTWVSGSSALNGSGNWGSLGTPSTSNIPNARYGAAGWVSDDGYFWVLGGFNGSARHNDLWRYNPVNGAWTWMKGSSGTSQIGTYGTQGTASSSNKPGARYSIGYWNDMDGRLWAFGGSGMASSASPSYLNDLWSYDPSSSDWTWMKGSSSGNQTGTYGNMGLEVGMPGARVGAAGWTDSAGVFWLFGGSGYPSSGSTGSLNDLWKWDPNDSSWTFIMGAYTTNQNGNYGTLGSAASSNQPGARYSSSYWIQNQYLYLFGGYGYGASGSIGYLNDIWRYNLSTNQWTWIKGSSSVGQTGTYGTQGTSSSSNVPGGRNASTGWLDDSNSYWLFGGFGRATTSSSGFLSDLWKYNMNTNEWTWMKGPSSINQSGTYGTQGSASSSNNPGARSLLTGWFDEDGNGWIFGGQGHSTSSSNGTLNDVWKYTTSTNQWTWIKGSNSLNQYGTYGTQGVAANSNTPGGTSRYFGWKTSNGNFWVMSGLGYGASSGSGRLSSLWKYDPANNQWTWMKGSSSIDQNGIYGTLGQSDSSNIPGSRYNGLGFKGLNNDLWIFGGSGYAASSSPELLNDLWLYKSDTCTIPSAPTNTTASANLSICSGQSTTLSASGNGTLSWYASATSTTVLDTGSSFTTPTLTANTTYYVGRYTCTSSNRTAIAVTVNPAPSVSITTNPASGIVCSGNNMTLTATGGGTYAWSGSVTNGTLFVPSSSGTYTVTVTSSFGCTATGSVSITVATTTPSVSITPSNVTCFGFGNGQAAASASGGSSPYTYAWSNSSTGSTATGLGAGIYTVTVTDNNGCTGAGSTTITQPAQLSAVLSVTNVSCNGGSNGSVTANVSGGTTSYSYNWNTSATSSSLSGLTSGTYSVTVTDANNCTSVASVFLSQPSAISASISASNIGCFGQTSGSLTASATGGTGSMSFAWNNSATTATISSLSAGTYTVTATDALGCTSTATAAVTQPSSAVSVSISSSTNVSCNGGSNGTATASATGGTGTKTYLWSGGGTNATRTGMNAGTYTVTATDQNGCTATTTVAITQPSSAISVSIGSVTNVSCNGGSNGQATAAASGGTGTFSYLWSGGGTSATKSSMAAGTYTVTATDQNGCTGAATVAITQPSAISLSLTATNISCNAGSNGQVSATSSGGTGTIAYAWNTGSTAASITGLTAGTYSVTATDQNGCTTTATAAVTQPAALSISISSTNISCNGGANGSATASATGGTGTKTYLWSTSATTATISSLTVGTYTVTATDAMGCTTTGSVNISQPATAVSVSIASSTNVTCFGTSTGSATASATGGTGTKTYSWSGGGTSATKTNLSAGTYTVTATDANGCTATTSVVITQSGTAVSVSIGSVSNATCNGGANGQATASASGGTGTYTYAWSGGGTSATKTGMAAGTYTVTASDQNSCTATATVVITQPAAIVIPAMTRVSPSCNGGSDGTLTANPSGGTPGYTYLWNTGGTSNPLTGLTAGTYSVTVTDAIGCTKTATRVLGQPAVINITKTITNVGCNGGNTGAITAAATGGTGTKTFAWNTGATGATITALTAGTYTVTATDANACTNTSTAVVTQPASAVTASISTSSNVSCNGGANGSATATSTGGTGTKTYAWSNSATGATATGLAAGTYTVTATDANSCTGTATVVITQPASVVSVSISSSTNVSCFGGNNGSATASATGGTGTKTYAWSGGGTSATKTTLAAGTYTVTATDANGCTATTTVVITQPASGVSVSIAGTNVTCNGGNNGHATATGTGGTGTITYAWSGGGTSATKTTLAAGTYTVTATDANSCTATATVVITQPTAVSASTTVTNASCSGGANGTATASATGGTGTKTYAWSTGGTGATITGLTAGTYTVTATDANSCTNTATAVVTQPASAVSASISTSTNVSCNGGANGSATASATGGTGSKTYAWSNSATGATATGLAAGTYTVTATDANACTGTATVVINQPASAVSVSISSSTNVSCFGSNNGSATASATGGTGTKTFAWSGGGTTATKTTLAAGTYTVTATDANGCSATASVVIAQPTAVSASITGTNVSCNGGSNGTSTASATGGTGTKTYAWSNSATGATVSGLTAGTYTVTATDANACTATATLSITEPAALVATTSATNVSCFGGNNGTATVSATGGTGTKTYAWNTGGTGATITGLTAGTYTVTTTDANACTNTATTMVTQPSSAVSASISTSTNVSCNGGANGSATASATGGTGTKTYAWSNSSSGATATGLAAGTYTVTATDANSCTATATVVITQPATAVSVSISSSTNVSCFDGNNGSATASATGGTGTITYLWSNSATGATAPGLIAGTYTVTATDANACTATTNISITQPTAVTASISGTNVSCFGGATGSAIATATGGTGTITYAWSNSATGATTSGLTAGIYTVTATDANSCTATSSISITEPALFAVTDSLSHNYCFGDSEGGFYTNISGGVSPYHYLWSTGDTFDFITNLPAGTYTVTATDANGCTATVSASITQPTAVTASFGVPTMVSCFNGNNGQATAAGSGGTSPYYFSWSGGGSAATKTGLTAGTYTVTVSDDNGCSTTASIVITQPTAITINAGAFYNVSCNGGSNGSASASATGGTGTITFVWSTSATSATISGLTAGTYTVTATDAMACTATATAVVTQPNVLTASINGTNVSCNGMSNGSATAIGSGGTSSYTYLWNNSSNNPTISGLSPGTYYVTITNNNVCTATASVTITEPDTLMLSLSGSNPLCNGTSSGEITSTVSGGTSPYTYAWSNSQTTATASNLLAGAYTLTITDSLGCQATDSTNIYNPTALSLTLISSDNVLCQGGADGDIAVQATGGTGPISYLWSNASTTSALANIVAGQYCVTVSDTNGCADSLCVDILEDYPLPTLTLGGDQTACIGSELILTPGGGFAQYHWSTGETTLFILATASQTYGVTVTDINGCSNSDTAAVSFVVPPAINLGLDTLVCTDDSVPTVTLDAGAGYLTYHWSTSETTETIDINTGGLYSVTVSSAPNCLGNDQIIVVYDRCINVDVEEIESETPSLLVFPNPNFGAFTLEWTGELSEAELHDIAGRIVWKGQVNKGKNAINLSDPRAGVYMLRLQNNEQTINQRVVVE